MNLLAIDPGASGGMACHISGRIECWKMPDTQPDILVKLAFLQQRFQEQAKKEFREQPITCYIEDLPKYIRQASKSTLAVMFENYGYTKGVLQALKIRTILVTPQKWQKYFGFGTKGLIPEPKEATPEERKRIQQANAIAARDWKNKLKAEAQRRFPLIEVTLNTCDALLILDYARMCENGHGAQRLVTQPQPQPSLL